MVKEGRTSAQAMDAGSFYRIGAPGRGWYNPPAAETPAEVLACWQDLARLGWFQPVPAGTVFQVQRIIDTSRGYTHVEDCGTITA